MSLLSKLACAAPPEIFLLRPLSLDDALVALPTCPFPAPRHNFAPSRGTNANLSRANSESNSLDLWASARLGGHGQPESVCLMDACVAGAVAVVHALDGREGEGEGEAACLVTCRYAHSLGGRLALAHAGREGELNEH